MPNTPVKAEGMRIEPAPSVPMCRWPRLSNAAQAAPPDEPPGVRSSFHGLRVMPVSGEWQAPIQPNSGSVVLPRMTAPASRSRATAGASSFIGVSGVVRDPRRDGNPLSQTLSFTVAPMPSARPIGSPLCQRASDSFAALSAPSRSMMMKALSAGSNFSMRSSWSRVTSTGESSRLR